MGEDQVASLRAEIKAWERDFKSKFSRDPTVQDIRDQPAVADKYKSYKKLSKAASLQPSTSQTPVTPPKHSSRSHIIPKPRPVQVVPPLPGFNPFSPVKNKGKQRDLPSASSFPTRKPPSSNPFLTPSKNVPSPSSPSISPNHVIQVQPHSPIGTSQLPTLPNTAVSRARKRLRGEPVSPSPNKQKRQRVGSHTALPFPNSRSLSSDDEDDAGEMGVAGANNCFIDDSPVKPPAGGKSFKLLFEDTLPVASVPKKSANGLKSQSRDSDDAVRIDSNDTASLETSPINSRRSKTHPTRQKIKADKIPTSAIKKDEFLNADRQANQSRSGLSRIITLEKQKHGNPSNLKTSLKRPLSEAVAVNDGLPSASCSLFPLLPPSPTHEDPSLNHRVSANAKGSRKKAKVVSEEDEDEDSLDEIAVKVINRAQTAQQVSENADELDWDPILHNGAHSRDPDASGTSHHETGSFSVDLPDELRLMLAISPSRNHNVKQERVFRGLLYGDRVSHYDASRGGDIWDVGEAEDDTRGSTEGEDDWEGAPIPWEVGEL
ncbi:hypothetical protein AZE42_00034 [Rhizopogon vesiculosus]|uniref:DNA replication regulator SLD2 n=1 Tax=Rhizopogon vesiculosus TaxID=180088 RepID=A0A1J8Q516_9AGAM|nr:hypothetical protein AZE42_00034 [Rhizopogon vesiculosus]